MAKKLFGRKPVAEVPQTEPQEVTEPTSLVCPEHGVQQIIGLSVCPICGEPPVET